MKLVRWSMPVWWVLAACSHQAGAAHVTNGVVSDAGATSADDEPDSLSEWVAAVAIHGPGQDDLMTTNRMHAMVAIAMFDAVNAVDPRFEPYLEPVEVPVGPTSAPAAAASAAHEVLSSMLRGRVGGKKVLAALDAQLQTALANVDADEATKARGVELGRAVARRVVDARAQAGDDNEKSVRDTPREGPGAWTPTPPAFAPGYGVGWGHVTPFATKEIAEYDPGLPTPLHSDEYAADLNEVKAVGGRRSECGHPGAGARCRTSEQTNVARLIAVADMVTEITQQVLATKRLRLVERARVLALIRLATADARIAAWRHKYIHDFWRPVTAIRRADEDGNPATSADAAWEPLLDTPAFPEFPSGHATVTPAGLTVLIRSFGDEHMFRLTAPSVPGFTREYSRLSDAIADTVDGRVWAGIHFRASDVNGAALGKRIADATIANVMRPR